MAPVIGDNPWLLPFLEAEGRARVLYRGVKMEVETCGVILRTWGGRQYRDRLPADLNTGECRREGPSGEWVAWGAGDGLWFLRWPS